ncbi:MAG: GNAT family N-acetyltransferase [Candidatus Omnitrophica bacterium]|nr:GNAT family N-acetyltransferase [Candidatus Omnitrophota bacterium]MBU4332998.1 GNAT family N-acetyltransferase [Candidatus Omnitrophota bacterium]
MLTIHSESDLAACGRLWEHFMPSEIFTDLWEARICFNKHFDRKPFFVVAEDDGKPVGFLPLSWIEENDSYGYFPGEVWDSKTWLEQNRIFARDKDVLDSIFAWMEEAGIKYSLRYILPDAVPLSDISQVDEIGYLFHPKNFGFSMDEYYGTFSRKSIKSIKKDVENLYARELTFRFDEVDDIEALVKMNMERFGEKSYFADIRFYNSFKDLVNWIKDKGWLKVITVIIENKIAAVDVGCLRDGFYTLFAGGTNADFPGVAKVINLYHINQACEKRYEEVDFLCGDFSWKRIFRLEPRPLFLMSNIKEEEKCLVKAE